MEYFVTTQQLSVGYDGKPLIRDIEIRVAKGRILTLIGPNGAGKSTILKTITRHLKGICGTVCLNGRSIGEMSGQELARSMSVMLTERMRTERMNCEEIVETGRYPYTGRLGLLTPEDHEKVREAMELTKVTELRDRDFMRISDGQRQRVLLARAIAQEPEVLVLDEPTSFLDVRYELELLSVLRDLARKRNIAVIMSLHELDLAQRVSDDVMCVRGEWITDYGSAEEIFQRERICRLYDLNTGSYNPLFGSLEMKGPEGTPRVFIIAGGGTGIPVYRALQKEGIPFLTGILHENDVDWQVARDLAAEVVAERPFEPISPERFGEALEKMRSCGTVLNCLREYGSMNEKNRELLERARTEGLRVLTDLSEVTNPTGRA